MTIEQNKWSRQHRHSDWCHGLAYGLCDHWKTDWSAIGELGSGIEIAIVHQFISCGLSTLLVDWTLSVCLRLRLCLCVCVCICWCVRARVCVWMYECLRHCVHAHVYIYILYTLTSSLLEGLTSLKLSRRESFWKASLKEVLYKFSEMIQIQYEYITLAYKCAYLYAWAISNCMPVLSVDR